MTKKGAIRRDFTEREERFLDAYFRFAGDLRKVQAAGFSPTIITQIMKVPIVKERIMKSVDYARKKLQDASPHLVNLALEIVNDDNINIKVRASLLDSLLDRAGVHSPKEPLLQVNINTEISDRARAILAKNINKGVGASANMPITIDVQADTSSDMDIDEEEGEDISADIDKDKTAQDDM